MGELLVTACEWPFLPGNVAQPPQRQNIPKYSKLKSMGWVEDRGNGTGEQQEALSV